ncbi:hypothetical protein WJX73_004485 [Symbiochloris irregularis]|uniref:RING-type E3 ubiquitin transferase n=1 Tax=Symbiochloris irregularis TaxID=706552 RepID=A0AAW1PBN7_9CHLO
MADDCPALVDSDCEEETAPNSAPQPAYRETSRVSSVVPGRVEADDKLGYTPKASQPQQGLSSPPGLVSDDSEGDAAPDEEEVETRQAQGKPLKDPEPDFIPLGTPPPEQKTATPLRQEGAPETTPDAAGAAAVKAADRQPQPYAHVPVPEKEPGPSALHHEQGPNGSVSAERGTSEKQGPTEEQTKLPKQEFVKHTPQYNDARAETERAWAEAAANANKKKKETEARAAKIAREQARQAALRKEEARQAAEAEQEVLRKFLKKQDEEKRQLQQQMGLGGADSSREKVVLGRCALRGIAELASTCEAHDSGYEVTADQKYYRINCSEACALVYHFPSCFRSFERQHKATNPSFNLKGSSEQACPTPGCCGYITLGQIVPPDPKHDDFVFSKPKPQPPPVAPAAHHTKDQKQKKWNRDKAKGKGKADAAPAVEEARAASPPRAVDAAAKDEVSKGQEPQQVKPLIAVEDLDLNALKLRGEKTNEEDDRWNAVAEGGKGKRHRVRNRTAKAMRQIPLTDLQTPAVLPDDENAGDPDDGDVLFAHTNRQQVPVNSIPVNPGWAAKAEEDQESVLSHEGNGGEEFPALVALTAAQQNALKTLKGFQTIKETCFVLLEDIPIKALDELEADVTAEDHVISILQFYGQAVEIHVFRSIGCALACYSQLSSASKAVRDLQAEVLVQGHIASTAHFLISFPDQKLRQRLLRELGEPPEAASAAADPPDPLQKALDKFHDPPAPPRTPEAAKVLEVPRRTALGSPFSAQRVQDLQLNGAAGDQAGKPRFNVAAKEFVPSRPPSMSSLVSEDRLAVSASEDLLAGPSDATSDKESTALVFFDVNTKELHGLWEAQPGVIDHPNEPGQSIIVFELHRKWAALPVSASAALLETGTNNQDFRLPQALDKPRTGRLLNAFNARARELGQFPEESDNPQPIVLSDLPARSATHATATHAGTTHMNGSAAAAANAASGSGQLNETELQEAFRAQQQAEAHFAALRKDAEYAAMLQEQENAANKKQSSPQGPGKQPASATRGQVVVAAAKLPSLQSIAVQEPQRGARWTRLFQLALILPALALAALIRPPTAHAEASWRYWQHQLPAQVQGSVASWQHSAAHATHVGSERWQRALDSTAMRTTAVITSTFAALWVIISSIYATPPPSAYWKINDYKQMAVEKQAGKQQPGGYQTPNAARADAIRAVASGGDGRPVASVGLSSRQFSARRTPGMETVDLPFSMSPPGEGQRTPGLETVDLPASMSPPSEAQRTPGLETVDLPFSMSPPSEAQRTPGLETVDVPAEMTPPLRDIGRKIEQRADDIRASGRLDNAAPMSAKAGVESADVSSINASPVGGRRTQQTASSSPSVSTPSQPQSADAAMLKQMIDEVQQTDDSVAQAAAAFVDQETIDQPATAGQSASATPIKRLTNFLNRVTQQPSSNKYDALYDVLHNSRAQPSGVAQDGKYDPVYALLHQAAVEEDWGAPTSGPVHDFLQLGKRLDEVDPSRAGQPGSSSSLRQWLEEDQGVPKSGPVYDLLRLGMKSAEALTDPTAPGSSSALRQWLEEEQGTPKSGPVYDLLRLGTRSADALKAPDGVGSPSALSQWLEEEQGIPKSGPVYDLLQLGRKTAEALNASDGAASTSFQQWLQEDRSLPKDGPEPTPAPKGDEWSPGIQSIWSPFKI